MRLTSGLHTLVHRHRFTGTIVVVVVSFFLVVMMCSISLCALWPLYIFGGFITIYTIYNYLLYNL